MPIGDVAPPFVLVVVALLALAVLVATVRLLAGRRPQTVPVAATAAAAPVDPPPHVGVVANPTKIDDLGAAAVRFARSCHAAGLGPPVWHQTTREDPGHGQTRAALDGGAVAVLAVGGDGTVRAVASELAGTGVPLGIIPAGTGNLLARNLSLPLTDQTEALAIAVGSAQREVDLGSVEIDVSGEDHAPQRAAFCVMAGIGFDAEVMATVQPHLKERVGWWAYIATGLRRITGHRTRVTLRLDDGRVIDRPVRSVVVGNCGELTGGVPLMPSALIDDGLLDVAVLAPRGAVGWGAVVATVLTRLTRSRLGRPVVQHLRCRSVEIRAERPLHVQLDGDPVGTARVLRASVQPRVLVVRAVSPTPAHAGPLGR